MTETEMQRARIVIASIGGRCPLQAEGMVDGVPFYFRARGEHWSMEIGPGNTSEQIAAMDRALSDEDGRAMADAVQALPCWRYEEQYPGGPYSAGWMDEGEACEFIAKAADLWRVASRVDPALVVDPSRSSPDALAPAVAAAPPLTGTPNE